MRHGALYGAIIGDVVGSIYEFHNVKSKDFPLLTEKSHFTDDTAMTIAVANALIISGKDDISGFQSNLISEMQRIGRKYPNAGYAGKFSKWLNSESPVPYESFGNGSAMRVSPCALVADSMEEAEAIAEDMLNQAKLLSDLNDIHLTECDKYYTELGTPITK